MKYFIHCPTMTPPLIEREGEPININGFHFAITQESMDGDRWTITELITGSKMVCCESQKEAYGELLMLVNSKGELGMLKRIVDFISEWGTANKIDGATK